MSEYRNEVNQIATESRWTFFRFLPLILAVIVIFSLVGFTLKSLGLIGGTFVERKVFEQSYQRSEALKSQIATDEAVLAEVQRKLMNPSLDENTRYNLEAQAAAARVRITATRSKQ